MSFLLIFLSLYHGLSKDFSYKKWFFLILLLFLIGGSKLTFIIYAFSGIIIHDILYYKPVSKNTVYVLLLLGVFVILNMTAPGNFIRLEEETMPKDTDIHMGVVESIIYRISEMEPFLLNTLFLLPIATQWTNKHTYNNKLIVAAMAVFGAAFILDSVVMYICFNDSGPLRVYFVSEVFLALLILFGFNHLYTSLLSKYDYTRPVIISFLLMVAVSHLALIFQVPKSIEYSEKARNRDKYVMSCADRDTIEIALLPSSYLILSYFSNDEIWLERIYLPYFQKENKFVLLETRNDVER